MIENENATETPAAADHLAAIRRLWWIVAAAAVLGAIPGLFTLKSGISRVHRVVLEVPYRLIVDDNAAALGLRTPSQDAAIALQDRSVLAPGFDDVDMTISGDDNASRITFAATASSDEAANTAASQLATAFVTRLRSELQDKLDKLIAFEKSNIADALKRRNEVAPSSEPTLDDLALTLEIVDRSRRLSSYESLHSASSVFGDPRVFDRRTVSGSSTAILLTLGGGIFGALLGAVAAAGIGLLDRRIRTRAHLESTAPGLDVLAVVASGSSGSYFLAAAGALRLRCATGSARIAIVSVGERVDEAGTVADQLNASLQLLAGPDDGNRVVADAATPSLTDDQSVLTSTREADGVILVSKSGTTRDAELAEAVSSLRLIGVPIVGQILVGVPNRELGAARAPRRTT